MGYKGLNVQAIKETNILNLEPKDTQRILWINSLKDNLDAFGEEGAKPEFSIKDVEKWMKKNLKDWYEDNDKQVEKMDPKMYKVDLQFVKNNIPNTCMTD